MLGLSPDPCRDPGRASRRETGGDPVNGETSPITGEEHTTWSNGITLKKTRDGYSWTISIAPTDQTFEAMEIALNKTIALDEKLRALYGGDDTIKTRIR